MSGEGDYFEKAFACGFVDRLKTAFWVYDFDQKRVVWANRAALGVWQAETLDDLRMRDLGADMSPSVEQRLKQYRDDFIDHDATFSELWTLYPDGAPITLRVVYRGFRMEDDRMAMLCEGLEAEAGEPETLRSADALLHTAVMISLFSQDGEQLYRNPAARIAYGGAPQRLADQFVNIADYRNLEDNLSEGRSVKLALQMRTAEGLRWHDITAYACKDAVTGVDSVLVSEIDISEMKAAELRLRDFAEVGSDWFWEMDADLRYTWLSNNVEVKTGVPASWHYGKTRKEILSPDGNDPEAVASHLDDLRAQRPYRDFRMLRRGPDGDRWLTSSGEPMFNGDGRFSGYRGFGADITNQVEAEQRLARQRELEAALAKEREINGLQRQFVSMVSHEFRTPLSVIDGNAQRVLRKQDKLSSERIADVMHKIRRSVAGLTDLMESVLNAARLEEGRITFEPGPCDLAGIVRDIAASYADVNPDYRVKVDIKDLPDQIVADTKLIRQVVSNLTSNAIKYSPAGTTVWLRGESNAASGSIKVSVRDEGVGIPEAELEKLCDRFFRASTSTGIAGTGIGLHLCQHFVSLHGGAIEIDSIEGQGSTFTMCLPGHAT